MAQIDEDFEDAKGLDPRVPVCGKCNLPMTPADSRLRPELFLHDACLPAELRPNLPRFNVWANLTTVVVHDLQSRVEHKWPAYDAARRLLAHDGLVAAARKAIAVLDLANDDPTGKTYPAYIALRDAVAAAEPTTAPGG